MKNKKKIETQVYLKRALLKSVSLFMKWLKKWEMKYDLVPWGHSIKLSVTSESFLQTNLT